jgi:hypothetical protein
MLLSTQHKEAEAVHKEHGKCFSQSQQTYSTISLPKSFEITISISTVFRHCTLILATPSRSSNTFLPSASTLLPFSFFSHKNVGQTALICKISWRFIEAPSWHTLEMLTSLTDFRANGSYSVCKAEI